jgi:hypothetical protein
MSPSFFKMSQAGRRMRLVPVSQNAPTADAVIVAGGIGAIAIPLVVFPV